MEDCPHCHRRLLSHASLNCNWCGQEIDDPGYQSEAKKEQGEFLVHDQQRIALEQARTNNMRWQNVNGVITGGIGYGVLGNPCGPIAPFGNAFRNPPISPPDPVLSPLPDQAATPKCASQSNEPPPLAAGLGTGLPKQDPHLTE